MNYTQVRELQPLMSRAVHAIILTMFNRSCRHLRPTLCAIVLLAAGAVGSNAAPAEEVAAADHIVVHKSQHKLYLYSGDRLLGEYKVALGL